MRYEILTIHDKKAVDKTAFLSMYGNIFAQYNQGVSPSN